MKVRCTSSSMSDGRTPALRQDAGDELEVLLDQEAHPGFPIIGDRQRCRAASWHTHDRCREGIAFVKKSGAPFFVSGRYRPRKSMSQVIAGRMVPLLVIRPLFATQVDPTM